MLEQTTAHEINSREEIVKKLKEIYKLIDNNPEDLQRKRAEFLAGFEALGDWHAGQRQMVSANLGNGEIENPEITEENKLIADRHLLKAVALYNMAIASEFYASRKEEDNRAQKTISSEQLTQQQSQQSVSTNHQRLIQKIKSIEGRMVLSTRAPADSPATEQTAEAYWQKNLDAKNKLQIIRGQARESLVDIGKQAGEQAIESETYAAQVQHIYHNIAAGQQQLVRELLDECLQQLPPPEGCIYSIIVLGSLAREEATPYSDFEWAILFEDAAEKYRQLGILYYQDKADNYPFIEEAEKINEKYKTYFRRLAELLWIKVLNLGETTSRMMNIDGINGKDDETYGPIPKGFSFDGQMADGCHTPLGNRHHKAIQHKYELIGTPHELAQFQQNTWEHKRGLSTVLSTVAVIRSNDAALEHPLVEQYESEMEQIWNTPEEQTDQRTGEVTHQTLIQRRSLRFLEESSESFQFRGGRFDKEAHYFDAKYHLYRLPNMLIDHLASYFGITQQKNLWDRIEAIWGEQGVAPNPLGKENLEEAISDILAIRSLAYLRKGYRDDHVLMFEPSHLEKNQHLLQTYLGINQERLFEIFYVLVPLQFTIEEFVKTKRTITTLVENSYYDSSHFMQAWIHNLLLNYKKAAELYEEDKRAMIATYGEEHILIADTLTNLGMAYKDQGYYTDAIEAYAEAKRIYIATHGEEHISVADTLTNFGNVYRVQGHYVDAIATHETAMRIKIATHGERHISVANTLNNLGLVYQDQGRYEEAITAYEAAKRIKIATHGEKHILVADTLINLANVYQIQARYAEAIEAYEEAKRIYIATHGEKHILVATTLINLGNVYQIQARYAEAIAAYEVAKRINIATHGDQHVSIAKTWNNLGLVHEAQGHYTKAIAAYTAAKRIKIATHGEEHISVANTLSNLGNVYSSQGHYAKAIAALEEAKCIYIATHGEGHISITDTLISLGNVYSSQGRYEDAIAVYEEAKRINIATHGEQHISIANTLNNLGVVYQDQGRYTKAIEALESAKRIYIATHGKEHIAVADTLGNLGNIYRAQGRYLDAIAAYEATKRIYITTHGEQHILVAETLNNLGLVYQDQGRYEDAIAAYTVAKRIKTTAYGEQHVSVAGRLHNLGLIFGEQKRFKKARHLFRQAIPIYKRFNHPNLQIVLYSYVLSYLREGNAALLQKEMDIEQAARCYQAFNQQYRILAQPVDLAKPHSHQQLANLFYQYNRLLPTIEHYRILLRLAPDDVSAHQNLACMLHVRSQIEKDKGDEVQYKMYLEEIKSHFEAAIEFQSNTGACTEYALFMWKNRDHFQVEEIIAMLQQAIALGQLKRGLSYGMMERPTVIEPLQELIDEENSISFEAVHLAYYLQVLIRCETNQFELANGDMSLLAAHVIEFDAEIESRKQQLPDQVDVLRQQLTSKQVDVILNKQQETAKELEKQQRLANKLVELSQATIEAKQKKIAALAVQANTEVEQQIEIKKVMDAQSQMSPQPLLRKSTSLAQLIPQFSSVIQRSTTENSRGLQQALTTEGMTNANSVIQTTPEPDTEHYITRKLTQ